MRKSATQQHKNFVLLAIKTVLGQYWSMSNSKWLSSKNQNSAMRKSQWVELQWATQDSKFAVDREEEGFEGCWLPSYKEAIKLPASKIIDLAKERVAIIHKQREELQLQEDAENACLLTLAAAASEAPNKKAKCKAQRWQQARKRAIGKGNLQDSDDEDVSNNKDASQQTTCSTPTRDKEVCIADNWSTKCKRS